MAIVNSELLRLAKERFSKSAVVMNPAADPNAAAGAAGMPPTDPSAGAAPPDAGAAGAPPVDPSMAAVAGPPIPAAPPAPAPAPAASSAPAQQKLKPEQMMQMIDYRLYNMQQQLTAIMNAMGVQLPPEAIVLPPGSTSAPPAEQALPGGSGAPAPTADPAAGGGDPTAAAQLPQDVYAGPDPTQNGGVVQPIPPTKAAWWQQAEAPKAASYIGDPVPITEEAGQAIDLQVSAGAAAALLRSLTQNAR